MALISGRALRWALLAAAVPTVWACNARPLAAPEPRLDDSTYDIYQQSINRRLDVVFMIDDSSSMTPLQNKLTASFPAFMHVLEGIPGGLPDVHIGVVSSSMGAGRNPDVAQCPTGGDRGVFQSRPVGATCAAGSLNAGQRYISNVGGVANYTGDIADVFGCIAALGDAGCGFEHQFASVLRALGADGQPPPLENSGFLRDDAALAIILITNEDDCSAPPDSALFDSSSQLVSDPLGPLQSYRCNEFGHLCGGRPPPRTPAGPTDLSGTCVSAEDGRLLRVADVVASLKKLKPGNPNKVLVAAITGPPDPYVVDVAAPELADPHPWPFVEHSCTTKEPDGSVTYGDPSVRIRQWVSAFGQNGVFESICGDTFQRALTDIASGIAVDIHPPCVRGQVLDTTGAPWTGTTTPDCAIIDHGSNDQNVAVDSALPACAPGQEEGPTACWYLTTSALCTTGPLVNINRPGGPPIHDLDSTVSCSVEP
ncbi:MAG TPA: hypothetical protein VLA14_06605 [Polyangia bacterium]|jgi:hypothetical protein|nr:hypothetical protein [Polyangia bacterium]